MNPDDRITAIRERLATLQPDLLEIHDDSARHVGHAHQGGGHFSLCIRSAQFSGKPQVLRHRTVYNALRDMIPAEIHALSIVALAPDESAPFRPQ